MLVRRILKLSVVLFFFPLSIVAQEMIEYTPDDAVLLHQDVRDLNSGTVMKLGPGVYDMQEQLYFQNSSPVLEGSGSGFGPNATVLDFASYSTSTEDSRALSVRGAVTIRNLTIINVMGRVADLRTGTIVSPSNVPVIFENVWFVNNNTVLKSTGGRTVGTPEAPMILKNCVFANGSDYSLAESQQAVTLRDTSYALFDHCDFFNINQLFHQIIDDPAAAPNSGPGVVVKNSIILGANGADSDDIFMSAGTLSIENSVLWESESQGEISVGGGGVPSYAQSVTGNPLYVNVSKSTSSESFDFNLLSSSPASGLGTDGLNAGSLAEMPTGIEKWDILR